MGRKLQEILHIYPPMKMEQTQCSETLAFKLQTPVNHPEESIRHSEHGESLNQELFYCYDIQVYTKCKTLTEQNSIAGTPLIVF
jgi:hypothetical protein